MTKDRWSKLSFAQQMGNIGSEICRARICEEEGSTELKHSSLERAFELIDLTLDVQQKPSRRRELTRFREVVADWYADAHTYNVRPRILEDYCISFMLLNG